MHDILQGRGSRLSWPRSDPKKRRKKTDLDPNPTVKKPDSDVILKKQLGSEFGSGMIYFSFDFWLLLWSISKKTLRLILFLLVWQWFSWKWLNRGIYRWQVKRKPQEWWNEMLFFSRLSFLKFFLGDLNRKRRVDLDQNPDPTRREVKRSNHR